MELIMEPFRHHVFVCTQPKPEGVTSCPGSDSWAIVQALERESLAAGIDDKVQVTTCGCLGLCDDGPIVIVYPEGIWYRKVKEADVPEIATSHLRDGKPVSRLAWLDADTMRQQASEHRAHYRAMVKSREEAGIVPDDLNEMIRGFMPSRAVLTALELDVFTAVGAGRSAGQVSEKLSADARATELLLNALVSLRLLGKKEDIFFNTPVSARFLSQESRDSAREALMHTANLWGRWSTLSECVLTGKSVETRARESDWVRYFIAAMDRNAKERAASVLKAVKTTGMKRMLDLGGGSAAYSIAFVQSTRGLKSDIIDLAAVVPLAQEKIREAGLTDRITVKPGDMLCDPLGAGYDVVLLSAICHMFSVEENKKLVKKSYGALTPKGQLVIQDFILDSTKTAPRSAALFSLNMLVGTRAGRSYSEPEYTEWLKEAGFMDIRRERLPGPSGLVIGVRP
jgi:(2Fe-2S) ferredoxin/ubiquinone/menaquinone biosynthesis C-methylase UbiE